MKELIYKYFNQNETFKWVDVLPLITKSYNERVNRITGVSPEDGEKPEFAKTISYFLERNRYLPNAFKRKPVYKKNQKVRIVAHRDRFARGFDVT